MWYVRDVLYAVLYVRVSCFVVRGCGVSRRYIDVCYCDMFSVVNVYLDHLKFYVVCINSRRYVCCSECDVVSNECNEPTSCLVQPIGAHWCEVMYFWCFGFRGELGFLNCDDVCMCVVSKQFELLEFVSESVYVDLQYVFQAQSLSSSQTTSRDAKPTQHIEITHPNNVNLKLAFHKVASFHPHYSTFTPQTYHHPVHRFRS